MGAFEYTALDTAGREQNGVVEGDTVKHVRQILRDRQLLPVSVAEVKHGEARRQRGFSLRRGVSASDLSLLTRQLATLVKAGLPLEEALLAVSQQSEKPRVQMIMLGVRAKVMEGHTLADGLGEFPRVFPEIYRSTVSAGVRSAATTIAPGGALAIDGPLNSARRISTPTASTSAARSRRYSSSTAAIEARTCATAASSAAPSG